MFALLALAQAATPQTGDLVFHESTSSQAGFLKAATGSRYTHVGVVVLEDEVPWVIEAVQPAKKTPLAAWIDRGVEDHVVVMRPQEPLDEEQLARLVSYAMSTLGTDYDLLFAWSDEQLYCSELAWKAYAAAGIQLVELRRFEDFDLSSEAVKQAIAQRYGSSFDPRAQVVGPADLMASEQLETISYD